MTEKLQLIHLDATVEILKQDTLRYCDGNYPERNWVGHFFTEENCFAFGYFEESKLMAVVLAEKISFKGCMLWYLATHIDAQNQGYGSQLLIDFQKIAKTSGVEWLFLNATENSLPFYSKHQFQTSTFSKVWEHYKEL